MTIGKEHGGATAGPAATTPGNSTQTQQAGRGSKKQAGNTTKRGLITGHMAHAALHLTSMDVGAHPMGCRAAAA